MQDRRYKRIEEAESPDRNAAGVDTEGDGIVLPDDLEGLATQPQGGRPW
jgi:hypothetical protein